MKRHLPHDRAIRRKSGWLARIPLLLALATVPAVYADDQSERPADSLLRLVPPDVAVVVTIEGLRDHSKAFGSSQLAGELRKLPAVNAWFESDQFHQLERSRASIEAILGANLIEIRDEIFGDAVALALKLPADAPAEPSRASGLVLLKARDLSLLRRVIRVINTAQEENGELARIAEKERNGTTYHVREFPPGANRQPEWYVTYPDGIFALSNSEALIHAVMDRQRPTKASTNIQGANSSARNESYPGPMIGSGIQSLPRFQAVRRRLPEQAFARIFVDPRPLARLFAASAQPHNAVEGNVLELLKRYIAAVDYAGAAVLWSERSLKLHTVETLDPSRLDPWIVRWAGDARPFDPILGRLPPTAIGALAMHVDLGALSDVIRTVVSHEDQPKLANFETILTGLLLGQDAKTRVFPGLGPGAIAYLDVPEQILEESPKAEPRQSQNLSLPVVLVVGIQSREGEPQPAKAPLSSLSSAGLPNASTADAVDNALRTFLALLALDQERAQGRAKIATRMVAGVTIYTLDIPTAFAYAIDRNSGRLIASNSADAVARYLEAAANPQAGARIRQFQTADFAGAETFGCIDLETINRLASRHRPRLAQMLVARQGRSIADVERDLTQVLALADLIDYAFVMHRIDPRAIAIERSAGVILRAPQSTPATRP
jgi:hypothetical protein